MDRILHSCICTFQINIKYLFCWFFFIFRIVLSLLGLLVLSATLYDGWKSLNGPEIVYTKWGKLLLCFSALENGRKVLSTEGTVSDMPCLHGIRFLSVTWIILFHVNLFMLNVSAIDSAFGPDKHVSTTYKFK